jgi:hypothetical protein
MRDELRETVDYVAICRLQNAYADAVTRRDWAAFAMLFLPSAALRVDTVTRPAVELTGPAELGRFIASSIERFEFFEFAILNTHVELDADDDDRARGRVYICELRQDRATGHFTNAFGLYQDRYERADGRWQFARRDYQSLARSGRNEVFPFPAPA